MTRPVLIMDCEVYKDYFLVAFRNVSTGNVRYFEKYDGQELDSSTVNKIMNLHPIVTFNGINFDMPVLYAAIAGKDNAILKGVCDYIIQGGYKPWHCEDKFSFKINPKVNHIDIIEVAPGKGSLKTYGGRLHTKTMQDLPIDPSASIAPEQREELRLYCGNDLRVTQELYEHLKPQIALREEMGKIYGIDLRSKSDAQIAEHVLKHEVEKTTGKKITKPVVQQHTFKYIKPNFIRFATPQLQNVLQLVLASEFHVAESGKVLLPDSIKTLKIKIGDGKYTMGIGGLHSTEGLVSCFPTSDSVIRDFDVASYYPSIILQQGLSPLAMGETFLPVYKGIVEKRLAAKASGDKVTADSLKITINGGFGKFGSKYSVLYAPHLLIQTTITGQLALLMLIEALESRSYRVLSANTDGIAVVHRVEFTEQIDDIIREWQSATGFVIEAAQYRGLFSKDVNNYIALKHPKGYKLKGTYAPAGLMKNPTAEICIEAVIAHLDRDVDVDTTIRECNDFRKFVSVRAVKGGAIKDGEYLGKVIRFYYGLLAMGSIEYKLNGYHVPRSDGAEPCMTLPDEFPCDVNYDWYITEARTILREIGNA